ncbi:uncharacterized protein [Arachis hypogaea]|uniref:uncharacterized protein n=1 Tax=Arachis hypogaea TaxID=3818 RepID=UPI003B225C4B
MAKFVVLRDSTTYNVILERNTINKFLAVIYTKFLAMKFVADNITIGSIRGDLETTVACNNASLSLRKKSREASGVFLADLDARVDDKPRPKPQGNLEKFQVGDTEEKFTFVNRNLPHELKGPLMEAVRANDKLFAWTPANMPGVDPEFMSYRLAVKPDAKPVAQRRRKMSQERANEVAKQTASLLEAGFVRELEYSTWLSIVVLINKVNGKWRMYIDYSDLNKACPKDSFPLPNIDALVDAAARYRDLIGKTVEVYVDDVLVKTAEPDNLVGDLETVFKVMQKPDLAGRMMTWAVELSRYNLQYEPRYAIKAQAMVEFLVKVMGDSPENTDTWWKLHVDGASNQSFGGARIILESSAGVIYEQLIKFDFPISNNQGEYEALIGGLVLAKEVGASRVEVNSDSQIVISQVNRSFQARDFLLQKYLEKVKKLCEDFEEVMVQHVPREKNSRADLLSKLASTKPDTGNRSLIQGLVTEPLVALCVTQAPNYPSWMDQSFISWRVVNS